LVHQKRKRRGTSTAAYAGVRGQKGGKNARNQTVWIDGNQRGEKTNFKKRRGGGEGWVAKRNEKKIPFNGKNTKETGTKICNQTFFPITIHRLTKP